MELREKLLDIIYPPTCPVCDRIIKPVRICDSCQKKLRYINSPRCLKCGKPVENNDVELCYDCSKQTHFFDRNVALWAYNNETRASIYRFKYRNMRVYGRVYASELYGRLGQIIASWKCDVIIPVPIHPRKEKERGFNQAMILAKELSVLTGVPVDGGLLARTRYTRPQKELNDKERIKNLENAFVIEKNVVQYNKVLLIDDIYTTGSTLDACASLLKSRGVACVYCVSLCIGRGF